MVYNSTHIKVLNGISELQEPIPEILARKFRKFWQSQDREASDLRA
jgi:hypothetical protein